MRKGVKIGAVVALVVALTSCSNSTDTTAPSTEPVGFANVETDATPTPEPLVAEAPTANVSEAAFLDETRDRLTSATQIPNATDDQLIAAGWAACAYLESGGNPDDLTVIEGETRNMGDEGYYMDSAAIATAAVMNLCPDVYN